MKLVELDLSSIPFGQPIPLTLRGTGGALLAGKGFVIHSQEDLKKLGSGHTLYVDTDEIGGCLPRLFGPVAGLATQAIKSWATLPKTTLQATARTNDDNEEENSRHPRWKNWQLRWTQLMRRLPIQKPFCRAFTACFQGLANYSANNADSALLALVQLSAEEVRFYSATHGMLVAVITMLVARETLTWPEAQVQSLGKAA